MYLIKQRIRAHLFVNFALYKYLIIIIIITVYGTFSFINKQQSPPGFLGLIFE